MNGLSVIIPSKTVSNLLPCVSAIKEHEIDCRIIIIDDGLIEGQPFPALDADSSARAGQPPRFTILPGEKPFIFSRNMNAGIAAAGTDDVVLLNDDAILETPNGFSVMQIYAASRPDVGLVSASTNVAGNPEQHRRRQDGARILTRNTPGNPCPVVAFVCVLIPRRTINQVGLLDERFGGVAPDGRLIYGSEDNDYCKRVADAGLKIAIHDGCYVDHGKLKSTFRTQPIDLQAGRRIFLEKWAGPELKLNLGSGAHPLAGFVNLDQPTWNWGERLPYDDEAIAAVTISHSLMYAKEDIWPAIFAEIYRVLKQGAIVRVTEDNTEDPRSERYGGFYDAIALTGPIKVKRYMEEAGFQAFPVTERISLYHDKSLIQQHHGFPPKVFHIEGRK